MLYISKGTPTQIDTLLRNARVVDGSGSPAHLADVGITGDRIVALRSRNQLSARAARQVVDLDGLVLSPGFIDVHTHYDAQILWDPDLTPSNWHGVTSVVMGNCGFGLAPARPEHREFILRTLENVEGMSFDALAKGVEWCFESFSDYLSALDARPKRINVGAFIGHSPLRLYVVGPEERPATADELTSMREALHDALAAGAIGFSTSRSAAHQGAYGRPVPSRFADLDEIRGLVSVLAEMGKGMFAVAAGSGLFVEEISDLSASLKIPATWTALLARLERPGAAQRTLERGARLPGEVYPQMACRSIVMQVNLQDPFALSEVDAWKEALALPHSRRYNLYRNEEWRIRARQPTLDSWESRWAKVEVEETEVHRDLVGLRLDQLAKDRGTNPFDLMIDLTLTDTVATRFRVVMDNDGEDEIRGLLSDERTLLGLSDAGAHASQLCDACFATHLLGYWVRERSAVPIERAVWKLTGQPAHAFRISRRGLIREGYYADLVAFDPDKVGCLPIERVYDQPGGADRLIVRSTGIEHVWVNGAATRAGGEDVPGAASGRLLRAD